MTNPFTKALRAGFGAVLSAVRAMRHPGQSLLFDRLLRNTRFDYRGAVGDGLDSSVVTGPIQWLQRALPEATLALRERGKDGAIEDIEQHDMLDLIQNPNPFYSDIALWGATVWSRCWDGNAYWIKVRNTAGRPVELWWVPPWMIEPKASIDGSNFIDYYEYTPGTGMGRMPLDPEDVVHFRHGINPRNLTKGISPLAGVIREIFIDLESSNFIASLLRNMGVPGVVISPKGGAMPAPEDVEATKSWFKEAFGGDNRGGPLVMGAPTDVTSYGFNPEQMNLSYGSDRAEERVSVCLGIPAAVVGFGAGLQQTKVGATMEELCKLAWNNGVLPLGRELVDELKRSLFPDFQRGLDRNRRFELYWNTDDVRALQEDENKAIERKLKEFEAGAITHFEYLTETGREADDRHKYYLRKFAVVEVRADQIGREPQQPVIDAQIEDVPQIEDGTDPDEDEEPEPGQKALPAPQGKNAKTAHDYLPADHGVATPEQIERGLKFVELLNRQQSPLLAAFEGALRPLFESWGDEAGRATAVVLRARGEKSRGQKADDQLIRQIIELLNFEAWEQQLSSRYQAQYLAIAKEVAEAIEESGFGTNIPDAVMREIISAGGTRAGLIDLDAQTKSAVFQALAEGRAAGEGVQALANRIANSVEGGRWGNAETRAKVIARTETKHAQNISTVLAAKANGVGKMVVFDGRFGEPRSELSHIARDGTIVAIEEALTMAENMRPNCTLSFAPHFEI